MSNQSYLVYRLDSNGDAEIYGKFDTIYAAKLSAKMLMIQYECFILSSDMHRIYFYENDTWDYDILTDKGKAEFLEIYPKPNEYL